MRTITLDEALKLPAGPELNRLVAEVAMGWTGSTLFDGGMRDASGRVVGFSHTAGESDPEFNPSEDMATAWFCAQTGNLFDGEYALYRQPFIEGSTTARGMWYVTERQGGWEFGDRDDAVAETAELAICRALLRKFWK